ncbi:hypothetical protein AC249_AIPGENE8817 [Exaiptasia diaphana]|nr:hypothetical protein AC249_AIPGENE8817 [Exaiptasia diaphana]
MFYTMLKFASNCEEYMKEPIIMISNEINDNISRSSVMFDKQEHEPGDQSYQETCFKRIDGPWSWIMSVLLMTSSLFIFGCASTYGILFPNILKDFKSTRALTGTKTSRFCRHVACKSMV